MVVSVPDGAPTQMAPFRDHHRRDLHCRDVHVHDDHDVQQAEGLRDQHGGGAVASVIYDVRGSAEQSDHCAPLEDGVRALVLVDGQHAHGVHGVRALVLVAVDGQHAHGAHGGPALVLEVVAPKSAHGAPALVVANGLLHEDGHHDVRSHVLLEALLVIYPPVAPNDLAAAAALVVPFPPG